MPYVSVFGNQNQSTPSPSNNTGYQSVFGGNTTWTNTQPSQPANTSKPQQSNPAGNILSGLGSAVQNVVTAVQSWFTPSGGNPTPVKLTNTQINQVQQAPAGLKVGQKIPNYQSPTQSSSAQPTKTASNIFDTSNYFPGVLDTLQQIGVDPLNLQSDPKKVIADAWNSIASAFNNVGKEGYQLGQDIRNQQSGKKRSHPAGCARRGIGKRMLRDC